MLCPNVETAAGTHLVLGATFAMGSAGCVELQKRMSEQETDPAPEANTPLTAIMVGGGGALLPLQFPQPLHSLDSHFMSLKREKTFKSFYYILWSKHCDKLWE